MGFGTQWRHSSECRDGGLGLDEELKAVVQYFNHR